jgi:hypothetical protein
MIRRKKERLIFGKLDGEASVKNHRENLSKWQPLAGRLRHVWAPLTTFIFLADRRAS